MSLWTNVFDNFLFIKTYFLIENELISHIFYIKLIGMYICTILKNDKCIQTKKITIETGFK